APICNVLTRFLVKSWRVCTVGGLEPKRADWLRSVLRAGLSWAGAASVLGLAWKGLPVAWVAPRPAGLKLAPGIVSELVSFSLNTTLRSSPPRRLMPL